MDELISLLNSGTTAPAAPAAPAVPAAQRWSSFQEAVFEDVRAGTGHTVVLARAGSGKTSTIVEALKHVPQGESALLVAFNKSIAQELGGRAPKGVEVMTLHSYGLRAVKARNPRCRIDNDKTKVVASALFGGEAKYFGAALGKAVSVAKNLLLATEPEVDAVLDAFQIDVPGPATQAARNRFVAAVVEVLHKSANGLDLVDFDDMIWLPVRLGLPQQKFDRVFIDETQDLNPCQIALALGCVKPAGRIVAVGDDRQAIYGFRGADKNAIGRVVASLGAKTLPLSITYRCPKAVVRLANAIVPDLQPAPTAPEGVVEEMEWVKVAPLLAPGTFVISRTNAPLVREMLCLVRQGKRATMLGRDFASGLAGLVRKSKASSLLELRHWLDRWEERETARLEAQDRDPGPVRDRADTLRALMRGAETVAEVLSTIDNYFADNAAKDAVVFASTHKAKGLEADRVVLMADTYRAGRNTEEDNLWYVAVTRARSHLVLAQGAATRPDEEAA